jgi:hypothetical protein
MVYLKWIVLIITILLFNTTSFFMRKRLSYSELYSTVLFALVACSIADGYASFHFKAWGFFEVEKVEFSALLIVLGIYPGAAAMIINWYPYASSWWKKFTYLMGWAIFSTLYEWLTLVVGILWHIKWNLFYSFLIYPFIYYMLIIHVRIYRKWMTNNSTD